MIAKRLKINKARISRLLDEEIQPSRADFSPVVQELLKKQEKLLKLAQRYPTPFFAFDEQALLDNTKRYLEAFSAYLPGSRHFYAMKVNHHRRLLETVIRSGFNIDASSGRELELAARLGAKAIVFSGPGKTKAELSLALDHASITTVHLDSWGELEKLGALCAERHQTIRAGVRVFLPGDGGWDKFGIPLGELAEFWQAALRYPEVKLCGIHFHTSWNKDATRYRHFIRQLAKYLQNDFSPDRRSQIAFVDLGGGFRPHFSEGYYPWKTPQGGIIRLADSYYKKETQFTDRYYLTEALTVEQYAQEIGAEVKARLGPLLNCEYYTEPGRVICNEAMHVVLRVEDIKRGRFAILDGGINIVGWERFEHDYFPVLNLTHPSETNELTFTLYGPLCMPQDLWGYYVFAEKIEVGDLILVPFQGALTYSLSQNFIKPIPKVYVLR